MGIFAVAPLTRLPKKHKYAPFESVCGMLEEKIVFEFDMVIHSFTHKSKRGLYEKEEPDRD